jgi:hypothetical protein
MKLIANTADRLLGQSYRGLRLPPGVARRDISGRPASVSS